jgi:Protein of unknown function (DUF2933)
LIQLTTGAENEILGEIGGRIVSTEQRSGSNGGWLKSRTGLVFLGFAAIALFFLWEEHKAHLLGALPYVLLLLCPLLHLFHGGHGGHSGGDGQHKDHS